MVRVHCEGFRTARTYCFLFSRLQDNTLVVLTSSLEASLFVLHRLSESTLSVAGIVLLN